MNNFVTKYRIKYNAAVLQGLQLKFCQAIRIGIVFWYRWYRCKSYYRINFFAEQHWTIWIEGLVQALMALLHAGHSWLETSILIDALYKNILFEKIN